MRHRKSRAYQKGHAHERAWAEARTLPRGIDEDVRIPGIGPRLVQIVVAPTFTEGYGWDIRTFEGEWRAYRSRIVGDGWTAQLSGYDELTMPGARLQTYFDQLCAAQLPLQPLLNSMIGLDGTRYALTIQGDMFSSVRLTWWSEYPAHWQPVVQLTDAMIAELRQCAVRDTEP